MLGVPFPFLWALWVALVDFLPMIGGALAGIPVVLFALTQGLTAGLVTVIVFVLYTQIENHVLNPLIMSRTVRINPLLVLISILVGASIGSWIDGIFGGFVLALLSIPLAGALQVIVREIWRSTDPAVLDSAIVNPPVRAAVPGVSSPQDEAAGGSPRTGSPPSDTSRVRQDRRAVPRRRYQWSRRLPRRRPDSAAGPPA